MNKCQRSKGRMWRSPPKERVFSVFWGWVGESSEAEEKRAVREGLWIRAPPAQVVAVAGIVSFWLWLPTGGSTYMKMVLPLLFMWTAYSLLRYGRLRLGVEAEPPKPNGGNLPWGVAFFLLLLLLLMSYSPNW